MPSDDSGDFSLMRTATRFDAAAIAPAQGAAGKSKQTQIKSKQTQINANKIAFFCLRLFFGIGTFQWVTADSNKKISSFSGSMRDASRARTPPVPCQ
jgi:hypothetical protein